MTEDEFLAKYVFYDVTNLNNGCDAATIRHFSYHDLEKVMQHAEDHCIMILGIEYWTETDLLGELYKEDYKNDPHWHRAAVASLDPKKLHDYLFAATFWVPDEML